MVFLFMLFCIQWFSFTPPASKLSAGSLSMLPASAWGLPASPAGTHLCSSLLSVLITFLFVILHSKCQCGNFFKTRVLCSSVRNLSPARLISECFVMFPSICEVKKFPVNGSALHLINFRNVATSD